MRCLGPVMAAVLAVFLAWGATAEQAPVTAFEELLDAYYGPLSDSQQGRLYDAVAGLLNDARELPDSIDLGEVFAAEHVEPGAGGAEGQPPARLPRPQAGEQAKWLAVLDHAVVADQELATTYFLAGLFQEAVPVYRRLREQAPDDEHLLVMLSLCERNAGNAAEARSLLSELQKKATEAGKWADWMIAMMDLGQEGPAEAK